MINFKDNWDNEENSPEEEVKPPRKLGRRLMKAIWLIGILIVIFTGKMIISGSGDDSWIGRNILSKIYHITTSDDKKLIGEEYDRINILLIGMGGKNHDGGYLADTIMLLSLKPSTKQAAMISIPRDLAVTAPNGGSRKINSVNAYAEMKEKGSGGPAMTQTLSDLLGTPIHYYVRVDFQGFISIIDHLGGITVNVERTLDDYAYPIMGQEDNPNYYARFEHLHVDAGPQNMNGSLALKFARSRHGVGGEGSDFARAKRQQLILQAAKDKLLSAGTLLNPAKLVNIANDLSSNINTNLSMGEMLSLWKDYQDIQSDNIINKVLDNSAGGLLVDRTGYDGAYLLVPRSGNFDQVKTLVNEIFGTAPVAEAEPIKITPPKPSAQPLSKPVRLTVLNGTWVSGLAGKTATILNTYGFAATAGNSPNRDIKTTQIYDLSYGKNDEALDILKTVVQAELAYDAPEWLEAIKTEVGAPNLILILGLDAPDKKLEAYQE